MQDRDLYTFEELLDMLTLVNDHDPEYLYSKRELTNLVLDAIDMLDVHWFCFSCGEDTFAMGEDYALRDELWKTYGVEGVLCIGCLETRLGRKLTPEDFKDGFLSAALSGELERKFGPELGLKLSDRLKDRLLGT